MTISIGGLITIAIMVTAGAIIRGTEEAGIEALATALEPTLGSWASVFISIGMLAAGFSSAMASPLGAAYTIGGLTKWGQALTTGSLKQYFLL